MRISGVRGAAGRPDGWGGEEGRDTPADHTAGAAKKRGKEKGASPKYGTLTSGVLKGDQEDGEKGREGHKKATVAGDPTAGYILQGGTSGEGREGEGRVRNQKSAPEEG